MKPIELAARRIALAMITAKAYDTEKRWIFRRSDLTTVDKAEIKEKSKDILRVLQSGKTWDGVLSALRGIATPSFYIGFKEQDRIIAACAKSGVIFADKTASVTRERVLLTTV